MTTTDAPRIDQDILDALAARICVLNAEGIVSAANRAWRESTALPTADIGQDYLKLCADTGLAQGIRAVQTGTAPEFRHQYPCGDIWFEVQILPFRAETPGWVLIIHTDISERVQAAGCLRASEERFATLFRQATAGLALADPQGRFVMVNDQFCRIVARDRDTLLRLTIQDVTHPDDIPENLARFQDCVTEHRDFIMEKRYRRPDGSVVWVRNHVSPIRGGNGQTQGVLAASFDITAAKSAEESLRASEARLRLATEAANIGLWDWDLHSQRVYFSVEWKRQLGYEANELDDHIDAWRERLHPEDRNRVATAFQDYRAGRRKQFELEFRLRHHDGFYRWVQSRGALLRDAAGEPYRMVGIHLDISERKQAELESRRRQLELDSHTRQQIASQTIAALAHELNQPLAAIATYADAALRLWRAGNPKPERLTQALERCAAQSQRAGQVVRELIAFLRAGKTATEPLDLNETIRETLSVLMADGHLGEFTTRLDLHEHLPEVQAHRGQLEKVLFNLLRNGVEAMYGAGLAEGSLIITVSTTEEGDFAQVTIRDSGPGLDPETVHRAFEPFFTTKPQSIGMGLAVSRAVIEAFGGKLWTSLDAEPGACFHFTLPFATAER